MSSARSSGGGAGGKGDKGKNPAWMGSRAGATARGSTQMWKAASKQEQNLEQRQRMKVGVAVVFAAALIGAFAYYLLSRPQATPVVVFRASAYPLRIPPMAFAQEDEALLAKVSPRNLHVPPYAVKLEEKGSLEKFREALGKTGRSFNPFNWRGRCVIVYLAAHGAVDERGQPCLIPAAGDPFNSQSWLALSEVLRELAEAPALRGKRKLLLLDCQRFVSCWRCGLLESSFAERVSEAVREAKDPQLYVMTAGGAGEMAWAAPELSGSVFGHFVARGLRGDANPEGGAVSLAQFFRYLRQNVNGYVQQRRGASQRPALYSAMGELEVDGQGQLASGGAVAGSDFTLAFIDASVLNVDVRRQQDATQIDATERMLGVREDKSAKTGGAAVSLMDVWKLYEQRRGSEQPGYVCDPVSRASAQQRLVAILERSFAGQEYGGQRLQDQINQLAAELADERKWATALPAGVNLVAAGRSRSEKGTQALPPGTNLMEAYLKEPDAAKKVELVSRAPRIAWAEDIQSWLTNPQRGAQGRQIGAELDAAVQVLGRSPAGAEGEWIETQFITLLQRWSKMSGMPLPAAEVLRLLEARRLAEQAATPVDARVHYAVERTVNEADAMRRAAEDQLYAGDTEARQPMSDPVRAKYGQAIGIAEQLTTALLLRDEVWSELPMVAEWWFARKALAEDGNDAEVETLTGLINNSIELSESLERVLASRDNGEDLTGVLADCMTKKENVAKAWERVRLGLADIAGRTRAVEGAYRRAEDVRDVELALRTTLFDEQSIRPVLEHYLAALKQWAGEVGTASGAREGAESRPRGEGLAAARREFFKQLHRALDFEFNIAYRDHRWWEEWDKQDNPAHQVFRGPTANREAVWKRLEKLLDGYNAAIQQKGTPLWGGNLSAVAAAKAVRAWDAQVRVAGAWLTCFYGDLRQVDQPTPARLLQQFDAAHVTSWHAARALGDFWGSGIEGTNSPTPFFASAVQRCEAAIGGDYRPIRYDRPGGGGVDFEERRESGLAALRRWEPIRLPSRVAVPESATSRTTLSVEIQASQSSSEAGLKLPTGTAALSLLSEASGGAGQTRFTFGGATGDNVQAVGLPVTGNEPARLQAAVVSDGAAEAPGAKLVARLWYRGHIRSASSPLGSTSGMLVSHVPRQPYSQPAVEVRGKDTARGAVIFVLDCSGSMRGGDGRFASARTQLKEVLADLKRNAAEDLHVGLMAFGTRTKAEGVEAQLLYRFNRRAEDSDNLTELGRRAQQANPNFAAEYPHPDRDVATLVPVDRGTPDSVAGRLDQMAREQCVGCSPLYYAITRAIQTGFSGLPGGYEGAKQIVVISDGVNMPYEQDYDGNIGSTGLKVNNDDLANLEQALAGARSDDVKRRVRVSVVLFVPASRNIDRTQLTALKQLAGRSANLEVNEVPNPQAIARSIRDSFPKTMIEVASREAGAASQQLTFATPARVAGPWPPHGILRREPDRRTVRLTFAGETTKLEKDVELVGGERVVLAYDPSRSRTALRFLDDEREANANSVEARPLGRVAAPVSALLVENLDPIRNFRLSTGSSAFEIMFPFRIRDKQWEERFTPRPRHVWAEIEPLGGGASAGPVIPCLDASWEDQTQFPVLQIPVERWPGAWRQARLRLWFRYDDPRYAQQQALPPGRNTKLGGWSITQTGGLAGEERKVVVTKTGEANGRMATLLEEAVWIWPPADDVYRRFALDGSSAEHEFRYSREGTTETELELRTATKASFQEGAYAAELEFVVN